MYKYCRNNLDAKIAWSEQSRSKWNEDKTEKIINLSVHKPALNRINYSGEKQLGV